MRSDETIGWSLILTAIVESGRLNDIVANRMHENDQRQDIVNDVFKAINTLGKHCSYLETICLRLLSKMPNAYYQSPVFKNNIWPRIENVDFKDIWKTDESSTTMEEILESWSK